MLTLWTLGDVCELGSHGRIFEKDTAADVCDVDSD